MILCAAHPDGAGHVVGLADRPEEKEMSASNPLTMTDFDLRRLDALFERLRHHLKPPPTLTLLERELERAVVVKPDEVPSTVVTMNTEVCVVDLDAGERRSLTLVFPSMADIESGRVSVLAPLGTALLGSCQGSQITWQTPRGPRRLRIENIVYQPEAAGRYDL
jgi:regulator of nucleoside diphosphate kinase